MTQTLKTDEPAEWDVHSSAAGRFGAGQQRASLITVGKCPGKPPKSGMRTSPRTAMRLLASAAAAARSASITSVDGRAVEGVVPGTRVAVEADFSNPTITSSATAEIPRLIIWKPVNLAALNPHADGQAVWFEAHGDNQV